jgi:hypothetical protein
MNRYQPQLPKAALASIAAGLSTLTLAAFVLAPATLDARVNPTVAAQRAIEVTITPARIDVYAVREPIVAWAIGEASSNCEKDKS